jgi:lysophospholipase L1-like esterase
MNIKKILMLACLFILKNFAFGQGTAFTYQGRLNDGGQPANGSYDFQFAIYDADTNGHPVGTVLTNTATLVSNGLFTATLDFGMVFSGTIYWLDISVCTNGGNNFTGLVPRQQIAPVPYAVMANGASNLLGTLPAAQLTGALAAVQLPAGVVTNGASGVNLSGAFSGTLSGNGGGLTGIYASSNLTDNTIVSVGDNTNWWFNGNITNFANYSYISNPSLFLIKGGTTYPAYQTSSSWYASPTYYQTGASGTGVEPFSATTATFGMDGNQLMIQVRGNGETFGFSVNGVDSGVVYTVPIDGADHSIQVVFATVATRTITLNNAWPFEGITMPLTNGFFAGQSNSVPRRLAILGDSFLEEDYEADAQCEGLATQLQLQNPRLDIWALGEGGTGFVNSGPAGRTNFVGRVQDVVSANPQYVLIYGGINDTSMGTNTSTSNPIYINATNLLFQLAQKLPNARLAVIGPQWPRSASPIYDSIVYNTAVLLSNACAVANVPYVNPLATPWITGNVTVPNSGNAEVYTRMDTTHPSIPAGAKYYASQITLALSQFWNWNGTVPNQPPGAIALATNSPPAAVPGVGVLWNSNNVLYWVTTTHTNYISGP